jgi:hypothetical protein
VLRRRILLAGTGSACQQGYAEPIRCEPHAEAAGEILQDSPPAKIQRRQQSVSSDTYCTEKIIFINQIYKIDPSVSALLSQQDHLFSSSLIKS